MAQQYMDNAQFGREPVTGERPVNEIVGELWENGEKLVRQERELDMAELDQKVDRVKTDLAMATMSGAVLYAGLLSVVAALVLLLSKAIDPWLSALIVGAAMSGLGYALLSRGKKDVETGKLVPKQTVHSVQRTAQTLKEAVK